MLILMVSLSNGQCLLSKSSSSLSSFDTDCNGYHIKARIDNGITINANCGNLRFTPPIIDVKRPNAVNENANELQFSISPNPFTDHLSISYFSNHQIVYLNIYDILGQLVYQSSLNSDNNTEFIDFSELLPGTYFVKLFDKSKHSITSKLIKI